MSASKISALTSLGVPDSGDLLVCVDVSDPTMGAAGTDKKVVYSNVISGLATSGANSNILSLTGLTTPLPVNEGGTGAATLTGILLGAGTSAITALSSSGTGNVVRVTSPTITTPAISGATTITGSSGVITLSASPDGGEYNFGVSATGTLSFFGSAGQTLDVSVLDGTLTIPHVGNSTATALTTDAIQTVTNKTIQDGSYVTIGSAVSVANNTFTTIDLDTEIYDPLNWHSTSVNPSRVIVPTTGAYEVNIYGKWADAANGVRIVQLAKNGTSVVDGFGSFTASNQSSCMVSYALALTANDYITCIAYQTSGGALNLSNLYLKVRFLG